jgi:hypothetical protein
MRTIGVIATTIALAITVTASAGARVNASTASVHSASASRLASARCTNGVSDRIGGRVVCIHLGGKCLAAHNARYRARGYTCVNGRLRRVKKVAISIGDTSGAEGNSGATTLSVPVTLTAAGTSTVKVDYATEDGTATAGSDYAAVRGTLTFRPGEREKTIPISIVGDASIEANETFTVTLSNPVNASIATATATATIANDDTAVPVTPGSYQGATQNGNFVFFTLTANRTITGFRVNDLPETCDPGNLRIFGAIDFGNSPFSVSPDGRISAEGTWSGSNKQGDAEWTNWYAKIAGFFDNPTTVSGTILEKDELNYKGTHYRCASGDIRWSATRRS